MDIKTFQAKFSELPSAVIWADLPYPWYKGKPTRGKVRTIIGHYGLQYPHNTALIQCGYIFDTDHEPEHYYPISKDITEPQHFPLPIVAPRTYGKTITLNTSQYDAHYCKRHGMVLDGGKKLGPILVLSNLDEKFMFIGVTIYKSAKALGNCVAKVARNFNVPEECEDIYSILFNPYLPYLLPEFLVYGRVMERMLFYNAPEWLRGWIVEDAYRRDSVALSKLRDELPRTPLDEWLD